MPLRYISSAVRWSLQPAASYCFSLQNGDVRGRAEALARPRRLEDAAIRCSRRRFFGSISARVATRNRLALDKAQMPPGASAGGGFFDPRSMSRNRGRRRAPTARAACMTLAAPLSCRVGPPSALCRRSQLYSPSRVAPMSGVPIHNTRRLPRWRRRREVSSIIGSAWMASIPRRLAC